MPTSKSSSKIEQAKLQCEHVEVNETFKERIAKEHETSRLALNRVAKLRKEKITALKKIQAQITKLVRERTESNDGETDV